jgi:hypothetical protein
MFRGTSGKGHWSIMRGVGGGPALSRGRMYSIRVHEMGQYDFCTSLMSLAKLDPLYLQPIGRES